jgi:hypothetical protein
MKSKVVTSFFRFSDSAFSEKVQVILTSLPGNAGFPTPVPALSVIEDAYSAFLDAKMAAASGNRADIANKKAKREALTLLIAALALYINLTAEGDRSLLLTSGFDVNKERQPVIIVTPENLTIKNGDNPGELIVSVKAVKGAKSYVFEYTADATLAESSWVSITSSSRKNVLTELESGKTYYCRVAAIGPKGQIKYSSIGSRRVL